MIQLSQITKRFPGIIANDAVDLTVRPGEIHALLGENGAGKSTLMQILYGFHAMDSGQILLDGQRVSITSPADAIALGIGMVHQDFMLVPTFTVAENTILGLREGTGAMLNLKRAASRIRELSEQHHLAVDPNAITGTLPVGVQQRVEILKLLYRDARVLILDEPTAVLTAPEKYRLFTVLRGLRAQGRSILIVTHKLHEIMELADRVTVMRDGRNVASVAVEDTSGPELARLMVGRDVNLSVSKLEVPPGPSILSVKRLSVRDHAGQRKLKDISLELHPHEILGIAGVDGNGQSELAQALLGLRTIEGGSILLNGRDITEARVAERRALGLAYVPADRRNVGSVADLSIADNAMLTQPRSNTRHSLFNKTLIRARAQTIITRFGVRGANDETHASKLSGGNLQKVILGREIMSAPKVLVVEQPTRGLDVGAIESIWAELLRERAKGTAILLVSAELEELLNLADRIAVMYEGRIVGVVDPASATAEQLGMMMAGTPLEPTGVSS
ncbi:simple sugar transport system ATP-binding protein [Granulicella aggregans]|uniref:Simple sugar transport system ATP-binding protein n=1 Tax=Granulicella aggregans TaxID=474949 RepID=A0A7W8E4L9_9BACT|nr:ABC transporter ATP-binding protein [Granulicella aggregans]MBB5058787.1 simple sugar transport system ATP-binding protein [Granulicella aggregans]